MKVVIAGSYAEFYDWFYASGLARSECYYLATYQRNLAVNPIPMIECKEDLVHYGSYKENADWPRMRKEVLLPMVEVWKQYWSERDK